MAAAADVLSADCRFNEWVATDVKKRATEEQILRLLEKCEAAENKAKEAMATFKAGGSHESLCGELGKVAALLNDRSL